jgi:hypothetical protein
LARSNCPSRNATGARSRGPTRTVRGRTYAVDSVRDHPGASTVLLKQVPFPIEGAPRGSGRSRSASSAGEPGGAPLPSAPRSMRHGAPSESDVPSPEATPTRAFGFREAEATTTPVWQVRAARSGRAYTLRTRRRAARRADLRASRAYRKRARSRGTAAWASAMRDGRLLGRARRGRGRGRRRSRGGGWGGRHDGGWCGRRVARAREEREGGNEGNSKGTNGHGYLSSGLGLMTNSVRNG